MNQIEEAMEPDEPVHQCEQHLIETGETALGSGTVHRYFKCAECGREWEAEYEFVEMFPV